MAAAQPQGTATAVLALAPLVLSAAVALGVHYIRGPSLSSGGPKAPSYDVAAATEVTKDTFGEVMALKEKVDRLSDELVKLDPRSSPYGELLEEIGELELGLYANDPSLMKPKIESVLKGLGFQEKDFKRDCSEFSGGWQMRIAMAKLFLQQPEVLLLDEPTNHLDIETQIWVEQYLINYPAG